MVLIFAVIKICCVCINHKSADSGNFISKVCRLIMHEGKWEKIEEKLLLNSKKEKKAATLIYNTALLSLILENRYASLNFSAPRNSAPVFSECEIYFASLTFD